MRILVTNDDGYGADGIECLVELCREWGEVVVVAPAEPQSGVGHQVTTKAPLRLDERAPRRFALGGTPADCARVALRSVATETTWLVAGINHGANLGCDTYISGTVAAAREAALLGVHALAISQYVRRHQKVDWADTAARARPALRHVFERPLGPGSFWNVNLPHPSDGARECELVECPMDSSPHAVEYEHRDGHLHWKPDYHDRPRLADHDVDVCFGGRVALTRLPLRPSSD